MKKIILLANFLASIAYSSAIGQTAPSALSPLSSSDKSCCNSKKTLLVSFSAAIIAGGLYFGYKYWKKEKAEDAKVSKENAEKIKILQELKEKVQKHLDNVPKVSATNMDKQAFVAKANDFYNYLVHDCLKTDAMKKKYLESEAVLRVPAYFSDDQVWTLRVGYSTVLLVNIKNHLNIFIELYSKAS